MKKTIIFGFVFFLVFTGCGNKKNADNTDNMINNNENVIADKVIGEISFTNTSLVYDSSTGLSTLTTTITNNSENDIEINSFNIYLRNEDGTTYKELKGFVGKNLKPMENILTTSSTTGDMTNIYSVEYSFEN